MAEAEEQETSIRRRSRCGPGDEARVVREQLVADMERVLGIDHPATLAAKKTLEHN